MNKMNKLAHITIVLILTIAVATSCWQKRAIVVNDNTLPPVAIESPSPETIQSAPASPSDLAIIKKYAESYEPKSGREVIPSPPVLDEKTLQTINDLANAKSREHEKYIILIFLRLSRFQTEHFNEQYELGRDNPLTKEFFRLIGANDYEKAEFMPSYLADNYVEKHPELLEYPLIALEMKRIAKAGEKIKKEAHN